MARTKQEFLRKLREIVARELDALPDALAAMEPDKRAAVAIKLLSITLDSKDLYSDDTPTSWYLPNSKKEAEAAKS